MADFLGCLYYVLYLGFIAFLIIFVPLRWSRRIRNLKSGNGLPAFANAVEGEIVRNSSSEYPAVKFLRNGRRFMFTQWVMGTTRPAISSLEVSLGSEVFFEATDEKSQRYPTRFPRARPAGVAAGYRIVSTNPAWAGRQLDLGLRDLLWELAGTMGRRGRIQLTSGRCLVEVERVIRPDEISAMLALVDRLIGILEGESAEGKIVILESGFDPARGRCPVCAEPAGHAGVACRECRAPHHPDCWRYMGRCGIFGCGSRQAA